MYIYFRKHTSQWTTMYFMFTSGFEQITCHQQYVITCWAYEVSLKNLLIRLFKWLLINVPLHVYVCTCFIIKILLNDRFSHMHIYCILSKYSYITVHLLHHVHGNVVCEDHDRGPQYIEKIWFNLIATLIEENKCLLLVVLQLFIMLGHGWGILCMINKLIFKIFQKVTQGDWY